MFDRIKCKELFVFVRTECNELLVYDRTECKELIVFDRTEFKNKLKKKITKNELYTITRSWQTLRNPYLLEYDLIFSFFGHGVFWCKRACSKKIRTHNFSENHWPYIVLKLTRDPHDYATLPTLCLFSINHRLHPYIAFFPLITAYTRALIFLQ